MLKGKTGREEIGGASSFGPTQSITLGHENAFQHMLSTSAWTTRYRT